MYELIVIIYMLLIPLTIIGFLWKIVTEIESLEEIIAEIGIETQKESKFIRKHSSIAQSNYDNAFGGKKAYDIYKNKDGLYEPLTPSKGIRLTKEE